MSRTVIGRNLYAIGGNPTVARLAVLLIRRYQIAIYAMSGTATGLAAMVMASRTMSGQPASGSQGLELEPITAAILGGCALQGGVGTIVGALPRRLDHRRVLKSGLILTSVPTFYQLLAKGHALQALYGVSRTSVREAVKFLSAKSMIEARPRRGMIVRGPKAWSLLDPEVLGWRQGGFREDPNLVRRASAADLAAIEAGYLDMAANLPSDLAACCKADLAFHTAIIQASGNLVFRHQIATIGAALEASFHLSTGLSDA